MKNLAIIASFSLAACSSSTAGTTGQGTTGVAASSTTGTAGASTGATAGSGSGGNSGSATSGGNSAGSSTGKAASVPCAPNAVWSGDLCLLTSCGALANTGQPCQLSDGGVGACIGSTCGWADLSTDPKNCGGYGLICPSGWLCEGHCTPDGGGYVPCESGDCLTGESCAGTACVTDDCASSQAGAACAAVSGTGICCGSTCSQLFDDPLNCGTCGNACPGGAACLGGNCTADCSTANANTPCFSAGQNGFCCNGSCETSTTDAKNCGACGAACPPGGSCSDNSCGFGCLGSPSSCSAGTLCAYGTWSCPSSSCTGLPEGSTCGVALANGQSVAGACCGGVCDNIASDVQNCGKCGTACGANEVCLKGAYDQSPVCRPAQNCQTGSDGDACNLANGVTGSCCAGLCSDLATDPLNCAGCYNACPVGATCSGGNPLVGCVSPALCSKTAACPAGFVCNGGSCEVNDCQGLGNDVFCVIGDGGYGECCGGKCINVSNDRDNCSACGSACPEGSTCAGSACTVTCYGGAGTCPAGTLCTGFLCLPQDCGDQPNGFTSTSACAFGPLDYGFRCCNGACASAGTDPLNCGGCGDQCPADALCVQGNCVSGIPSTNCNPACGTNEVCAAGTCVGSLCIGSANACAAEHGAAGACCPSGCADLLTDAQNCGACGFACPTGAACQAGVCLGSPCTAARAGAYCGTDAVHVCCGPTCTDWNTDPANCGACGHACTSSQTCQSGVCAP